MKKKLILSFAAAIVFFMCGCTPSQNQTESIQTNVFNINNLYTVVRVVDGDTIVVDINGKEETLRLIGIDTPETVHPNKPVECFGKEASEKAKEMLAGSSVYLENDTSQAVRDKYNRLLAYIILEDGKNFNQMMIREGYAFEYTYGSKPYKYQSDFKYAQKLAQHDEIGLWDKDTCP